MTSIPFPLTSNCHHFSQFHFLSFTFYSVKGTEIIRREFPWALPRPHHVDRPGYLCPSILPPAMAEPYVLLCPSSIKGITPAISHFPSYWIIVILAYFYFSYSPQSNNFFDPILPFSNHSICSISAQEKSLKALYSCFLWFSLSYDLNCVPHSHFYVEALTSHVTILGEKVFRRR